VSGMLTYQQNMDTLAHNMANVNTIGYKPLNLSFSDLIYSEMNTKVEGNNLVGHGVRSQGTNLIYKQGFLNQTENVLDFAIVGDGFFATEGPNGRQYTRNGAFSVSVEGTEAFLVTSNGEYALDGNGNRIDLDVNPNTGLINTDNIKGRLGIFAFSNPNGLMSSDGNKFIETNLSGQATSLFLGNGNFELIQGALEGSAVDMAKEMADVITTQKAFQFNSRMVQTADQIEDVINNLR
ncbi:MAG: flagellar hook-basal body protein, partial [Oscillospiraceae bacterium]